VVSSVESLLATRSAKEVSTPSIETPSSKDLSAGARFVGVSNKLCDNQSNDQYRLR
jgi:hypothetical protein